MAPAQFVPFHTFIQTVKDAKAQDFLSRPSSGVKDVAAFEEMRRYLVSLYRDVHVQHSYVLGPQTFDCVPIDQQPSVRALGSSKIAPEPPGAKHSQAPAPGATDEFGNVMSCEDHTIPVRRITLEQISQFRTLKEFLQKGPNSVGHASK